jgi:hypothetical protein
LEKIGLEYVVSVSTFHSGRYTSVSTWTMPTLEEFIESITHEQDKLIQMGLIKDSKVHALDVDDNNNKSYQKFKHKGKGKAYFEQEEEGNSSNGSWGSKGGLSCMRNIPLQNRVLPKN